MATQNDVFKCLRINDPIAAISTPRGRGAIGIVRLSGPGCLDIAAKVFRPKTGLSFNDIESHRLVLGSVIDPHSGSLPCLGEDRESLQSPLDPPLLRGAGKDQTIDEVLLAVMREPNSYTGQDMVEIHAHGGTLILDRILDAVAGNGCRLARPGEFTQRAFLNGRMTLTQAEAVADLIDAKTETAHRLALQALKGEGAETMTRLREKLSDVLIRLEATIDFPLEEVGDEDTSGLVQVLNEVHAELDEILRQARRRIHHLEGLRTPICGKRNVGKSSLLNRLLGKERALVTSIAGTTRDTIEEDAVLDGELLHLVDTAGVGDSQDPVELLGLQRTSEAIEEAELVLFVVDLSEPFDADDERVYELLCKQLGDTLRERVLLVGNKLDKVSKMPSFEKNFPRLEHVQVSALTGQGIDELVKRISAIARKEEKEIDKPGVHVRTRQVQHVSAALGNIEQALKNLSGATDRSELAIEDVRSALESLEDFDGVRVRPDVLEAIFSRFCIGK